MKLINRDSTWGDNIYCPALTYDIADDRKVLVKFDDGKTAIWHIWDSSNSWEENGCIVAYSIIENN